MPSNRRHRHMCVDNKKEYVHDHSDGSTHEDSKLVHEHNAHGRDVWVCFEEKGSDEDELQTALGFDAAEVTYTLKKRKRVNEHVGYMETLTGAPGLNTCIVCRCGWVRAFGDDVSLQDATNVFIGHTQPGVEWIG